MYTHTTVISSLVRPCLYKHLYLAGGHVMGKVPDSQHVIPPSSNHCHTKCCVCLTSCVVMLFILKTCLQQNDMNTYHMLVIMWYMKCTVYVMWLNDHDCVDITICSTSCQLSYVWLTHVQKSVEKPCRCKLKSRKNLYQVLQIMCAMPECALKSKDRIRCRWHSYTLLTVQTATDWWASP